MKKTSPPKQQHEKKRKKQKIINTIEHTTTTHDPRPAPLRTFVHPRRPSFLQERCVDQQIQRVVHSIDPDPIPVFHQCQWTGIWSIENIENRGTIEVTKNSFQQQKQRKQREQRWMDRSIRIGRRGHVSKTSNMNNAPTPNQHPTNIQHPTNKYQQKKMLPGPSAASGVTCPTIMPWLAPLNRPKYHTYQNKKKVENSSISYMYMK